MSTLVPHPTTPPSPKDSLLTAEQFMQLYGHTNLELIDGAVKELPMPGFDHGLICATIVYLLNDHVLPNKLGRVVSNDTFLVTRQSPDRARGMDVAYFSYARQPKGTRPVGLPDACPELVFEVRSPTDTWTEVFTKVVEYLKVGVDVVVVVDPETRTASVYRPNALQETFRDADMLTVPDVLPGFAVGVARLFE